MLEVKDYFYSFYCKPCKLNFKCTHQGLTDVASHLATVSHKVNSKSVTNNRTIDIASTSKSAKEEVIHVKVWLKNVSAQHNLSLLKTNHLNPHYKKVFPDLKIAKEFACSRAKTISILNEALKEIRK